MSKRGSAKFAAVSEDDDAGGEKDRKIARGERRPVGGYQRERENARERVRTADARHRYRSD
jgi:hypothetical protein